MTALPIHPLTGLSAIGWRKPRPGCGETEWQPVWPIRGGDGTDDPPDGGDGGDGKPGKGDEPKDPPADDPNKPGKGKDGADGGDEDWKAQSRKWEQRAKQNAQQLKEQADQLKKLEPLQKIAQALTGDGDGKKNDVETLTEQFTKLQEDVTSERLGRIRAEVAHEKGLKPSQAARLQGATREELEADADQMIEDFGISKDDGEQHNRGLYVKRSGSGDGSGGAGGSVAAGRDMYKPRAKNKQ